MYFVLSDGCCCKIGNFFLRKERKIEKKKGKKYKKNEMQSM